ncbi:MAG: DUF4089 domain-containing protein [Betaproteobacteria bacterium]|nr:DUF4089 domain-containing protein [Betaproteobacteria bacterium]
MNPDTKTRAIESYVDAALELNQMTLAAELRQDVIKQFTLLSQMRATLDGQPIPVGEEPSNLYRL